MRSLQASRNGWVTYCYIDMIGNVKIQDATRVFLTTKNCINVSKSRLIDKKIEGLTYIFLGCFYHFRTEKKNAYFPREF